MKDAISGTEVLALKGGDDCSMFDDHAADDSPVKKVRSEFVIVNLTIVTNLMMHDFDGHYLHVDFYLRRNMVTERLRMELIIGPDVFVGELHDVCKEFAEGRQVHSNLQSHDGGGSLARKVVVKFVIVVLTVAASLKGINGLRPITSSTVFRRGIERRTRMHAGGGRAAGGEF